MTRDDQLPESSVRCNINIRASKLIEIKAPQLISLPNEAA